ncbi:hypothetical protein B484DRAFT_435887 [Ochromonadaceae sp. CCMP2298]|nr:hypothetical protein B484DRAFT_435887 [Ochromonadaceae sp. CCMP2298]|mmetsp:Transcript_20215/g.44951  ORF Transcript_20215/g.44951 Transcript_20215/m.44951 type:complete len:210 (-) Transcript_20215:8-637(-)
MFKPSESANDLFRRLNNQAFDFRVRPDRCERLVFGDILEVQAQPADIPEVVLGTAVDFAGQYEEGIIFHLSTGNNLYNSVLQSQIQLTSTALHRMHSEGRVKNVTTPSLLHLIAAIEFIKLSLQGEKALLLLEGLTSLFLVHRAEGEDGMASSALSGLQQLCQTQFTIALWINSVTSKQAAGLREGPNARDGLSLLWKQHAPKLLQFSA